MENELSAGVTADLDVLEFIQNQAFDGLYYHSLLGPAYEWVNASFWQSLGYGPHAMPTAAAARCAAMHPADLAAADLLLAECVQNPQQPYDFVARYTHLDGSLVWMRCRGVVRRDAEGTPLQLIVTMLNITPEKQDQKYIQELADHYSLILGSQSVYIVKTDNEGNYTYANDFFYERFGYEQDIIGTSSMLSIIEEDRSKCLDMVMRCFAQPEVSHQVILRKISSDNSIKANHWELKGIVGPQGEVVEILCVGYDVTLLVENLHKLQHLLDVTSQQNVRLQNFAYIISHNIRSHSANLTSLVEMLTEAEDDEQRTMFLQMLQTSTEKLADTIVNLSDIVAVNSNVNKPKAPRVLRAEIDKTLETLSVVIRQHAIKVEVQIPADLVVTVVPAYLDSILLNLLSNAVKYRAPQRPALIQLSAHRESGFVVLTVQDNGLGLDLIKNQAKLFGMYKTFHDNEDARGVGLFITKNHIEAMQGSISVESEVGVGSAFKVWFNEKS